MTKKPSREELEKRVKELEKKIARFRQVEAAVRESEERYRSLVESTKDSIYLVDRNCRYLFINRKHLSRFGWQRDEVIGRAYGEFHSEEEAKRFMEKVNKVFETGKSLLYEYRSQRDGGYFLRTLSPVKDKAGSTISVTVVSKDITERKRAEEALRDSRNMLQTVLDSIPSAVFWKDRDSIYLGGNRSWLEAAGLKSSEEVVGKSDYDLPWEKEQTDKFREDDRRVMESGIPEYDIIEPYLRADGTHAWAKTNKVPLRDTEGNVTGVLGTYEDITANVQAEEALLQSKEKYRSIFNNAQVGIFRTRISDGKVLECNDRFARTFGYKTPEECITDLVVSEHYVDPGIREKMLAYLTEKGGINDFEACYSGKDGEDVWIRFSARLYAEEGYLEGIGYDITEEKRASEALRESEQKYRTLTDSSITGVFIHQDSKYVFVNNAFAEMHGYKPEELLGKDHLDLIHPDQREIIRQRADKRLKGEEVPRRYEIKRLKKDGEVVWHEIMVSDPITFGGRPAIMGHEIDISERKKAEEERARLEVQLQQARKMEAVGLLAGGVAHDLNNILSGIVSYPDLLLLDLPKDSPIRRPIEVIKESGQRAADVVSDLLTIARGIASSKEVSNLNSLVQGYLSSPEHKRLESTHSSIAFETVLEPELLNISCSPVHIKKSLMNLVINASEAIEGTGRVTISTTNRYLDEPLKGYEDIRTGEYTVLSVSDDGSGISPEDVERIFEPFYTKKVMGRTGTGLGLAVVWNTVQDHNGYINVRSSDKGAVFELYFPITREEPAAVKQGVAIEDYLGHEEKILVVDDEERQREIACGMLAKLGYNAEAVSSGEEAIEYVKDHPVALIVLDMIMPKGINGRKTYEEIIKTRPGQKAIIASGFSETKDVKIAQGLGAGKYIKKPYTLEKIGLVVKEELRK